MKIDRFLGWLDKVRPTGENQWTACCPAHDDKEPSLSVGLGEDQRIVVRCWAGCTFDAVADALDLEHHHFFAGHEPPITVDELAADKRLSSHDLRSVFGIQDTDEGVAIPYFDLLGRPVATRRRVALKATEGSRWATGATMTVYGLWAVPSHERFAQRWCILVEGESDVWSGWPYGFPVLGVPGATQAANTITSEVLSFFDSIFVIQEPDGGGVQFVRGVDQAIRATGWAGTAFAVRLSGVKDLNDLHKASPQQFVKNLRDACDHATPLASRVAELSGVADWPEPQEVGETEATVPPFDPALLLPGSIRDWVVDAATRMGAPVEYGAVAAIVGIGSVIGRQLNIRPKAMDDWLVVPNVWGAVVGGPGKMKSPLIKKMFDPLFALEKQAQARLAGEDLKFAAMVYRTRLAELEARMKDAVKSGGSLEPLRAQLAQLRDPMATAKRYVVNDITAEKLIEVLGANPYGVLLYRDELAGFFKALTKQGREGERQFFLEAWEGNQPFSTDRIGRGLTSVQAACVSVFGGIQPYPFRRLVRESIRTADDDGLLQRFQLLVEVDDDRPFDLVDRPPDEANVRRAAAIFNALANLDAAEFGATVQPGEPPFLRFAADAQPEFLAWMNDLLQSPVRRNDPPAITAHLAKYRSLVPALALIFHVADVSAGLVPPGPVTRAATERALRWAHYLEAHARRIYGRGINQRSPAVLLADRIIEGAFRRPFKARDVERKHWGDLKERTAIKSALDILVARGWLRVTEKGDGGQRTRIYEVNPKIAVEPE